MQMDHFRHWYYLRRQWMEVWDNWSMKWLEYRQVTEKAVFMYMSFVCYEFRKDTKDYERDILDA